MEYRKKLFTNQEAKGCWHDYFEADFMPDSSCVRFNKFILSGRGAAGIPDVAEDVAQPSVGAAASAIAQPTTGPHAGTQGHGGPGVTT